MWKMTKGHEIIRMPNEEMAWKSFVWIVTGLSGLELARKKKTTNERRSWDTTNAENEMYKFDFQG
jgi:hypothetical protein